MLLPNARSFSLIRRQNVGADFAFASETVTEVILHEQPATTPSAGSGETPLGYRRMVLSNKHSFLLAKRQSVWSDSSSATDTATVVISEARPTEVPPASPGEATFGQRRMFLPNTHSFLLTQKHTVGPDFSTTTETKTVVISEELPAEEPPAGSEEVVVGDTNRRKFLKVAGIAGAGLIASQLLPKKADALILGSSPTTGVVGVKNAADTRINPATEETLSTVLKTSDLTFDAGSLQVKVTGAGGTSFSDSGDVAKSALVDADRHVQVDVLSSALPSSASTETTLQTISFGGYKFTLRLDTVGSVDYVGEASIGTATSASSWRIKKVDSTTGIVLQWAGTGIFNQVWDNRASLTYS